MTSTVERKERQLRILTSKKETLFTRLQNLYDESKKARFRIRYKTLEQTKRDFERVVDDINEVSLDIDAEFVPNFNALERFDELYCHIQVVAETVLVRNTTNQTRNSIDENTSKKPIPRLPKLELPSFSGDLKEWPVFYECFKNLIHHNKELTAVDKIHYLIGKLSESALCVCAGIPPIGDNYDVIWAALVEKYQDKRQLASAYLESIIGFKPMQTESLSNLNLFIEKFDTSVAALKKETKDCFEMFRADKTQIPSYIEIINFIKSRAKVLNASGKPQFSSSKAVSSHSSKSKGPITRSFVVNKTDSDKRCIICNHVDHRYEFARGHRLCLNCLSTHRVIDCKSKVNCSSCHRRHHSLLHFENSAVNSGIDVTDSRNDSTSSTTVNATTSSSIEPTHSLCSTARSDFSRCAVDLTNEPLNRLDRCQLIDRMVQDYWRRWHLEYLTTLQVRERWNTQSNPIRAGTVVVIKQDGTPPFTWPLGIIEDTFPGKDGIVRVVSVRTKQGSFKRPVVKFKPVVCRQNARISTDTPVKRVGFKNASI
ncbi:hypothetical protein NQ317_010753 [Molorchus minor]|uniref:DUF5641 domain-containing protein n=1 Tax=Molorchus minor TaxID=1323400 RepID=A0ABQ9IS93_9CUCU|nr:hypothetical protein NQ317_010753 [Molorchus minor]